MSLAVSRGGVLEGAKTVGSAVGAVLFIGVGMILLAYIAVAIHPIALIPTYVGGATALWWYLRRHNPILAADVTLLLMATAVYLVTADNALQPDAAIGFGWLGKLGVIAMVAGYVVFGAHLVRERYGGAA